MQQPIIVICVLKLAVSIKFAIMKHCLLQREAVNIVMVVICSLLHKVYIFKVFYFLYTYCFYTAYIICYGFVIIK